MVTCGNYTTDNTCCFWTLDAPPQLTGGNAIDERYGRTSLHEANIDVLPYWPWSISDEVHPRDADNHRFRSKSLLDNAPDCLSVQPAWHWHVCHKTLTKQIHSLASHKVMSKHASWWRVEEWWLFMNHHAVARCFWSHHPHPTAQSKYEVTA